MRKRPTHDSFIQGAPADLLDHTTIKEDMHKHVQKTKWPIEDLTVSPSMASGSTLNKQISVPAKEFEWNSIDRHTRALGVSKAEWIRYAIFKLMDEEQIYFFTKKEK